MISIEEAYRLIATHVATLPIEDVALADSVGRVLSRDICADVDSPPHRKSLMDGFAVRSNDVNANLRRLKIIETVVAGGWPQKIVNHGEAARIMTGAPLPEGSDAVVMIEKTATESVGEFNFVVVHQDAIAPGNHVMQQADNFAADSVVLKHGHRIRPADVGLLAEVGAHRILAGSRPTVAVLPTGDELVTCSQQPSRGQIRNSNGPMLIALTKQLGLTTIDLGIGRDNPGELETIIQSGLQHDLFILSGGVSEGLLDLVPSTLQRLGVVEVFHRINIKPGKPIWFGVFSKSGRRCYVFGLPGNPVSSLVGYHLFVRTAIRRLEMDLKPEPKFVIARLFESHETRGDRPTYWPARWHENNSSTRQVQPIAWHGSSDLLALGSADGLIYFPGGSATHDSGKEVEFYPLAD